MGVIKVEILLAIEIDPKTYFHCEPAEDSFVFILRIPCEFDEPIILLQFLIEFEPILLPQVPNHSLKQMFLPQLVTADHISRIVGIRSSIALKTGIAYNKATQLSIGYPALYPIAIGKLDRDVPDKPALPTIEPDRCG